MLVKIPKSEIYDLLEEHLASSSIDDDLTEGQLIPNSLDDISDCHLQEVFSGTLKGKITNIGIDEYYEIAEESLLEANTTSPYGDFISYSLLPAITEVTCGHITDKYFDDIATYNEDYLIKVRG